MKYNNYLYTIARQFNAFFDAMEAQFNFDLGDEFEIALCYTLRAILPQKYGVCRGVVVAENNQQAGDDIIIYDRDNFPILRLVGQDSFDRKQYIPVEAVYAYIEAKNTLCIEGSGPQSLNKACRQVAAVKQIPRHPQSSFDRHYKVPDLFFNRPGWPENLNPLYGAIFARQIRKTENSKLIKEASSAYKALGSIDVGDDLVPDLIIAGDSNLMVPCVIEEDETRSIRSPFFYKPDHSDLMIRQANNLAFSLGMCFLLWALDTTRLGQFPWHSVLNEGINIPNPEEK